MLFLHQPPWESNKQAFSGAFQRKTELIWLKNLSCSGSGASSGYPELIGDTACQTVLLYVCLSGSSTIQVCQAVLPPENLFHPPGTGRQLVLRQELRLSAGRPDRQRVLPQVDVALRGGAAQLW